MEPRRRTWFDDRGLAIAGAEGVRSLAIYAGAMHYWRVEPARWRACLRTMHDQGLTLVETCVPWRVHEPSPGQLRWDGARDLARFVEAARAEGLAVMLRVGPSVHAELSGFGLPDHVLSDVACQARSAHGGPAWLPSPPRAWPLPSYASAAFRARVAGWFEALAEVIAPTLPPDGPVVALGVDHGGPMFFRLGAYDLDYHPDAVAAWRDASGFDGEPPRAWDPDDAARCVSWVRFKDQLAAHALAAFSAMLDGAGLAGIARFHSLPAGTAELSDLRARAHAIGGPVGIAAYAPRAELGALRRHALAAVGAAAEVPLALDVAIGDAPWLPPLDAGDDPTRERDQLLSVLAAGVRGFDLVMAVERERHYGAAIDRAGTLAPEASWIRPLIGALDEVDWPSLRRAAPVAVVDVRADARFGHASCELDPVTPVVLEWLGLGPGGAAELGRDRAAVTQRRWRDAVCRALELAGVAYTIVDEAATSDELAARRAVIAPTLERIDRGLAHTLRELVERRRAVVVIGPGTPARDELDQPLTEPLPRRVGRLKAGSLDDLPGLAADLAALAGDPSDAWQLERPEGVHAYAHAAPSGAVRAVFVASDVPRATTAVLRVASDTRALRDPLSHERIVASEGRVSIALPAHGIRMLIVEPAAS